MSDENLLTFFAYIRSSAATACGTAVAQPEIFLERRRFFAPGTRALEIALPGCQCVVMVVMARPLNPRKQVININTVKFALLIRGTGEAIKVSRHQ